MHIGFPKKFYSKTKNSIKDEKQGQKTPGGKLFVSYQPEDEEEGPSFQPTLVELRRMAGKGSALGKDHPPRDMGYPAAKFAIDEIPNSAQTESDGGGDNEKVGESPE